ncbi:MAG: hypothetical protein ACKPCJ_00520, partial [Betaproteobacteria bacterium]
MSSAADLAPLGVEALRVGLAPGHPCPASASTTDTVTAPPGEARQVRVVTEPSTCTCGSRWDR